MRTVETHCIKHFQVGTCDVTHYFRCFKTVLLVLSDHSIEDNKISFQDK